MYKLINNTMCVPATVLYRDFGIITRAMYNNRDFRKKVEFAQKGGNGRKAWLVVASLPLEVKQKLEEHIGQPGAAQAVSRIEAHFEEQAATRHFYETYRLPDGRYLTPEAQDEYTLNASLLMAVEGVVGETQLARTSRGGTRSVNWKGILVDLNELKTKQAGEAYPYKHSLPSSDKRLREALNKLRSQGLESLIRLGNYQTKNRAKVKTEQQELLLQEMFANGRNLENQTIADLYNAVASRLGWDTLSAAAVGVWRKKTKSITEAGRRGVKHYNNTYSMQVKRSRPSAPLYMWSADGWTAELLYQDTKIDKKGHRVTTYLNRLVLEVIMDAYNNYPVGYAIGKSENAALIEKAMRSAINHTQELFGERYRTWQIQSDNFQKTRLAPYWQALGDKWTPAQVGNAKAKPIEQWFKHEMQKRCQLSPYPNWSGYGVTASKDKQVNDEWLEANKKRFPSKEQCVRQLEGIVEAIRAEYREDFVQAFSSLPANDKLVMSEEMYLYKFGCKTEPNRMEGQGLTPRINGVEHWFDSFDLLFKNYYNEHWVVHYDPDDTSRALAVAQGKPELRFVVEQKYIQPMALRDRQAGDAEQLKRVKDFNQADVERIIDARARGAEVVQSLFAHNKELNGGLAAKLLVTDSQGQHKKHLYALAAEYETVGEAPTTEQEYLRSKTNINKYLD